MRGPLIAELQDLIGLGKAPTCRNCKHREGSMCLRGAYPFEKFAIPGPVAHLTCHHWEPMTPGHYSFCD